MSNTFFNRVSHCLTGPDTMPSVARPVFHRELGEFFREIRENKKLGLRQAAQIAGNKGLRALTKSALHSLEAGMTKNVDPDVLRALADLYEISYESLVARFVAVRYQITLPSDLTRHGSTRQTAFPPSQGESVVPASDRIRQLERSLDAERKEHAAHIKRLQGVAGQLVRMLAGEEVQTPAASSSKARRGHRRTG